MEEEQHKKVINAWCLYDWANSAFITTIGAAVLPTFFYAVPAAGLSEIQQSRATSIWGLTTAMAAAIVAVLAVVLGPVADYSATKKKFLAFFVGLGVIASFSLVAVGQGAWLLCVLLYVVGRIGFSGANVFYDSLLPHVAREDEIDQVSSKGYALGYLGGGILLAINIMMIMLAPEGEVMGISWTEFMTRLTFGTVGIWWLVFSIPIFRHVPEPPGSAGEGPRINSLKAGFARLGTTFRSLGRYRNLLIFLFAFWLYNDGISTIIDMATIYGQEVFTAQGVADPSIHLIAALLITQFVGIPFSFLFGWLARRLGRKPSIYLSLGIYVFICIGGFFMSQIWHFYALAVMVGFVQGGSQALSRSLFGSMTPKAKTAEFFGFFNIMGKFSAILGPMLFALVGRMVGESRWSIISLGIFFILGAILLTLVDEKEGIRVAREEDAALAQAVA
ncbi:MAG: MFS transporter [Chloroflexota bacterium]|nr:MFS transporter [Chloroflexota bacterium]